MTNSLTPADKLTSNETADYKRCKYRISNGIEDVGRALEQVRDLRLYREEYKSFEEFCQVEMSKSHRYVNRLIAVFRVNENLMLNPPKNSDGSRVTHQIQEPVSMRVAAELAPLPLEKQREAYQEAKETAPDGHLTSKLVKGIVEKHKPAKKRAVDPVPPPPSVSEPKPTAATKTYMVQINRHMTYYVTVQANSEEEAGAKALGDMDWSMNPAKEVVEPPYIEAMED